MTSRSMSLVIGLTVWYKYYYKQPFESSEAIPISFNSRNYQLYIMSSAKQYPPVKTSTDQTEEEQVHFTLSTFNPI
jgi:hypothetical protein